MISTSTIQPIYRVDYINYDGELQACSVFFQFKEDAREYAKCNTHTGCTAYIHKYWLK